MRSPAARTGRITTLFPIVVLLTLCFFALMVQGTPDTNVVARHPRDVAARRALLGRATPPTGTGTADAADGPIPSGTGTAGSSGIGSSQSSSSSSASVSSPTSISSTPSPSSSSFTSQTASSASFTGSSTSSSSAISSIPTSASPTSTSSSRSTSSSSSSTESSASLSSSSSSSTSSKASSITSAVGATTLVATNIAGALTTSDIVLKSSSPATTLTASDTSSSSKGFLANTGAVAATFSIVSIVAVGVIVAAFAIWRKKRRNQEKDIFDTQYNDYAAGTGDAPVISDMTGLSANAVSHAGANNEYYSYRNSEVGLGLPPIAPSGSIRASVASNHAGYGAFQSASTTQNNNAKQTSPEKRKSRIPGSRLRHEVASTASLYSEPSVYDDRSAASGRYESPNNNTHGNKSVASSVGTAH